MEQYYYINKTLSFHLTRSRNLLFLQSLPQPLLNCNKLAVLAQMAACLPLVQQIRGLVPGGVVNFHLKIFNPGARRGGDVHFLITRLYITVLD